MFDVIIAGGGIAGLSAALILGRCRRSVLVCDTGAPRNGRSRAIHGFLTRDGIHPLKLREIGYRELKSYPSVTCRSVEVLDAAPTVEGYEVSLADGTRMTGRYLLIATGVVDRLPAVPSIEEYYGKSVFHCPYCDGWENRDHPLAVYGAGSAGYDYALELTGWSNDLVLCTDGGEPPSNEQVARLEQLGIGMRTERLAGFEGQDGMMERIIFEAGAPLPRRAMFFSPDQYQASPLAEKLGCSIAGGVVSTAKFQKVHHRLFVAGDAARSVQLAVVAAAEGVEAAFAINTALLKESLTPRHR